MKLARVKAEAPFERFQRLIRGLALTPKKEIEAEGAKWKAAQQLKKKKRDTA